MRCISVRLSPSPRFGVLNATTVHMAISLPNCPIVRVSCAPQAKLHVCCDFLEMAVKQSKFL